MPINDRTLKNYDNDATFQNQYLPFQSFVAHHNISTSK